MPIIRNDSAIHVQPDGHRNGQFPHADSPPKVTVLEQEGFTFTLSAPAYAQQYENGNWAVLDDGTVEVASVTPGESVDVNGRLINGSMKNPEIGGNQGLHQAGWDGNTDAPRDSDYALWDPALKVTYPAPLTSGDALLAAQSRLAGEDTSWDGATSGSKPILKKLTQLTCVAQLPKPTHYRPAPTDRKHTRKYDAADIDLSVLPKLDTTGMDLSFDTNYEGYQPGHTIFDRFARGTMYMWVCWFQDFRGRDFHPTLHSQDYHGEQGYFLSKAAILMCTDAPDSEKLKLAQNLCRIGIDYYETGVQSSAVDSAWWSFPVLFAGLVLGRQDMLDCFTNGRMLSPSRDTNDFYYYEDRIDQDNLYASSTVPAGWTWAGHRVFYRNNLGLGREFNGLHPSEFVNITANGKEAWKDEGYRLSWDTPPLMGMLIALNMMGLQQEHGNKASFEMVMYWMLHMDGVAEHNVKSAAWQIPRDGDEPYSGSPALNSANDPLVDAIFNANWASYTWPSEGGTSTEGAAV